MKALLCIAIAFGFSSFSANSGEIIKREVQYGKSDEISTQWVYQSDKRRKKSSSRTSRTYYRPVRSYGHSYYYSPARYRSGCYRVPANYCGPTRFRFGCTTIRVTRAR